MSDDDSTRDSGNGTDRDPVEFDSATPAAEWAIAVIGAVLACAIIGYLAVEGLRGSDDPPLLSISVIDTFPGGSAGHVVQAEIANSGGRAAANVQVIGRLVVDDAVVEEVEAQLDYVPAKATRRFSLVFGRDPTAGRLEISPAGYSGP